MRYLVLLLFIPIWGWAQNSEAYSDEDLKNYLELSHKLNAFKAAQMEFAHRMQSELQISDREMQQTIGLLKKRGNWDLVKPDLDEDFATRFDSLMTYRAFLKDRVKSYLSQELVLLGWTEDFYQHFLLTLEADPALQERILKIKNSNSQ